VINQQVNLFQPIFRKERKILSFHALLQGMAVVSAVLVLLYGWGWQKTQTMEGDVAQLQGQLDLQTGQLAELSLRVGQRKPDTSLQQELARLQQEAAARQEVVDALSNIRGAYTQGVSSYLESFARQTPKNLWLTGFSVLDGGEGLVIRGSALKPSLVPMFLQQLSTEPALAGTHFGLLQIQRQEKRRHWVDFTVYTGVEAPQGIASGAMP
jgi:hypothetical protein